MNVELCAATSRMIKENHTRWLFPRHTTMQNRHTTCWPQNWARTSVNPEDTTCLTTHRSMILNCESMFFTCTLCLD